MLRWWSVVLLFLSSPMWAGKRGMWAEFGFGPWLPMFGTFKSDHDPGLQGRVRIGYDGQFTVPSTMRTWFPPLALFKDVYPFAEAYYSYSRLKGSGQDNVLYAGVGGRALHSLRTWAYGFQMSLGALYIRSLNRYQPAGFVGLYGRWDLRRFYLYAEYSLETSVDLRSSYSIDTSLSFLQRTAGWHEVGVGIGVRW